MTSEVIDSISRPLQNQIVKDPHALLGKEIPMNDVVSRYLQCWNETDARKRRALIVDVWSADATYVDPMAEARGRDAIDATIAAVQGQFPGFVFTEVGEIDAHHQQVRFSWGLGPSGTEPPIIGFDVATIDDDGRIASVLGFLDKVPS
jgi:hypothetical protein